MPTLFPIQGHNGPMKEEQYVRIGRHLLSVWGGTCCAKGVNTMHSYKEVQRELILLGSYCSHFGRPHCSHFGQGGEFP